jgi:hypothetical protein
MRPQQTILLFRATDYKQALRLRDVGSVPRRATAKEPNFAAACFLWVGVEWIAPLKNRPPASPARFRAPASASWRRPRSATSTSTVGRSGSLDVREERPLPPPRPPRRPVRGAARDTVAARGPRPRGAAVRRPDGCQAADGDHEGLQGDRDAALLAVRPSPPARSLHYKHPGSLAEVAELLGDSKRVAADHYVYALTDYCGSRQDDRAGRIRA